MRAAVFYGPNNIAIEDIKFNHECDSDEEDRILLKVNACAVCGYDVRVFRNGHKKVIPPIILGHELCGEIQKTVIAKTTTTTMMANNKEKEITIKEGTRVAVSPILPCLNCRYCQNQLYNLCVNLREIGSTIDGGFAEYIKIPKKILQIGGLVPIPDNLSNEEAALLEPLACCLNGFSHIGGGSSGTAVIKESSVVIIGDGPIGLLHLQLSKLYGAAKTIMVGKIPARIQKAKALGADRTVLVPNDSEEEEQQEKNLYNVLDFTDGTGADIVIVATSNPKALDFAMKVAGKNSKINIFAGMSSSNQANNNNSISLDPNWLHYNQISITGSFSSTSSMLQEAARLTSDREIDLSKIISHQYSLTNIEEAILATEKYYGLRVIINKF